MIESFGDRGLREFFETGRSSRIPSELRKRIMVRLDALNDALTLRDLDRPSFSCHPLKGVKRFAISVNVPWRITFDWSEGKAFRVELEQYH